VYLQETKRPSKEMQVTIARQLGLEPQTVGNFFMNARRRSQDKWKDDDEMSSPSGMGLKHSPTPSLQNHVPCSSPRAAGSTTLVQVMPTHNLSTNQMIVGNNGTQTIVLGSGHQQECL
jgi:hypothetical protein